MAKNRLGFKNSSQKNLRSLCFQYSQLKRLKLSKLMIVVSIKEQPSPFHLRLLYKVVSMTVFGFNNSRQAVEEIIPCTSQCSFRLQSAEQ